MTLNQEQTVDKLSMVRALSRHNMYSKNRNGELQWTLYMRASLLARVSKSPPANLNRSVVLLNVCVYNVYKLSLVFLYLTPRQTIELQICVQIERVHNRFSQHTKIKQKKCHCLFVIKLELNFCIIYLTTHQQLLHFSQTYQPTLPLSSFLDGP